MAHYIFRNYIFGWWITSISLSRYEKVCYDWLNEDLLEKAKLKYHYRYCLYYFMKGCVYDVHQKIDHSRSVISIFRDILDTYESMFGNSWDIFSTVVQRFYGVPLVLSGGVICGKILGIFQGGNQTTKTFVYNKLRYLNIPYLVIHICVSPLIYCVGNLVSQKTRLVACSFAWINPISCISSVWTNM